MIDAIRRFLEQNVFAEVERSDAQGEHALRLAAAALLVEIMRMDEAIVDAERRLAEHIVRDCFDLSADESGELLRLAEQEVQEATDYHQFTSLLNERLDYEQKTRLVEQMWRVAFADGALDKYEEHLVRKLAELLYVSHADFIAAKHRASGGLA